MPSARLRAGAPRAEEVVAEHAAVVLAVQRGDAETARAAMRVHLVSSTARLAGR